MFEDGTGDEEVLEVEGLKKATAFDVFHRSSETLAILDPDH